MVQVLRNNTVIFSHPGGAETVELEMQDPHWDRASYYYLRTVQRDGGRAVTTPVWIDKEE